MKSSIFLILCALISFFAEAQNRRPKIVGQLSLSTNEEQSITVLMSDLIVEDKDDWFYPWGFTMHLYEGSNYTLGGNVVTPALDFTGTLTVEVTVNDGKDDSNKYPLKITVNPVNDKPVITGNNSLSIDENQSVTILPDHFKVSDPDDKYPNDFTLTVHSGNNYTFSGNTITPATDFTGVLSVMVTVNDGEVDSEPYGLPVEVKAVNRVPKIVGQANLFVNEDESITIKLTDLTVEDQDSQYPDGFTLSVLAGQNYSVFNATVTPAADFYGKLSIPATVNDGTNTSEPFNLSVNVIGINDAPRITNLETTPMFYPGVSGVTETATIKDVDDDSIMFAEIGIRPEGYQKNGDRLVYTPTGNEKIRGVFDPNTGILTLLGEASAGSYTEAIRSVDYQGPPEATDLKKVIFIHVNDGVSDSETVERSLLSGETSVALDIPTGFTPNGDLANDTWKIIPLKSQEEYGQAQIRVYNKAGTVVYEATGFKDEWDGRLNGELLPADTYFYTIDLNQSTPSGYLRGSVTILR